MKSSGFNKSFPKWIYLNFTSSSFNLKISFKYNKTKGQWYPNFPNFPNFIEPAGTTPSTLSTNPKYDIYEVPKTDEEAAPEGGEFNDEEAF